MALSKLAIGLIAGIGSVAAISGITAGVVVSRNNTIAETANETDESNSKENKSSTNRGDLVGDKLENNSTDHRSLASEMKDSRMQSATKTEDKLEEQSLKLTSEDNSDQTKKTDGSSGDSIQTTQTGNNVQTQQVAEKPEKDKEKRSPTGQGSTSTTANSTSSDSKQAESRPIQADNNEAMAEASNSGSGTHEAGGEGEGEPQDL